MIGVAGTLPATPLSFPLIVVVIIGILAAIALPKFGNTKSRAAVATMKADLRNLATVQEAYFMDHNTYRVLQPGVHSCHELVGDDQNVNCILNWHEYFSKIGRAHV